MMKNRFIQLFTFLIIVILMALIPIMTANAEEMVSPDSLPLKSIPDLPEKSAEEMNRSISSVSDLVEISDEGFGILTGEGLAIGYTLTGDPVYVFTQDMIHQFDLYCTFFENPIQTILSFVYNGVHLNVYDPGNKIDMFVKVSETEWAAEYPETAKLSESDQETLFAYFRKNGFDTAKDTAYAKIGGNYWLIFDCSDTDGLVYMFTSVAGHQIMVYYNAKNSDEVQVGLKLANQLDVIHYKE